MAIAGVRPQLDPDHAFACPEDLRDQVQVRLQALLPSHDGLLAVASREALLGSGKRVRPVLAMLAACEVGGSPADALDFGCAVEMVHAASLVLDDLPCMDDAVLRRGQPTLHRSHGQDAAVLAAVTLMNQATRVIIDSHLAPQAKLTAIDDLTRSIGFDGLAEGQMHDLRDGAADRDASRLRWINAQKTGALFVAAVRGGGRLGGGDEAALARLAVFGEAIGFAFQLCDDLLDACSSAEAIGKDVRQDDSATFVHLWGEGRVRAAVRQSLARASDAMGADNPMTLYMHDLFRHADVGV